MCSSQLQARATSLPVHAIRESGGLLTSGRADKPAIQIAVLPVAMFRTVFEIGHTGPQVELLPVEVELSGSCLIIDAKALARNLLSPLLGAHDHILFYCRGIDVTRAVQVSLEKRFD